MKGGRAQVACAPLCPLCPLPPFVCKGGARQPPPLLLPLRAREGRHRSEVWHGTGHVTRDCVGGHMHTAPSPLPWFAHRGDTQTRGARGDESGCAPHTLSTPPPFARMGGALQPGAAPPSPGVGVWGAMRRSGAPSTVHPMQGQANRGHAQSQSSAPFPSSRTRANTNRWRKPPPPFHGFTRKGKREWAATWKCRHPPGLRARTKHHVEAPLPRARWCVTGRRADWEARPSAPPTALHTRAARIHMPPLCAKRKEHGG
ncbi:hypothetical protein EDB89DRAFT_1902275 [Lactarius sanguifluus]|nr:hypothetical protein EDB89DRAFT_1902275 [Lactarius sanguifluus]